MELSKILAAVWLACCWMPVMTAAFTVTKRTLISQVTASRQSPLWSSSAPSIKPSNKAVELKQDLLSAIKTLRELQERDGGFTDIGWGVKGGELNEVGRVPNQLNYFAISKDVGEAASKVMAICNLLSIENPTPKPTQFLGDKKNGSKAPLNGTWKLLYTNAADASFSKNSKRGAAQAQNVVDAAKGRITNVIDFAALEDGTEPALKQLSVIIRAIAVSERRVQLNFGYAKIVLTKFFFPLFGRKLSFYIPVPAAFVTGVIEIFRKMRRLLGLATKGEQRSPKGYFDILYLDSQLRVHKTGQNNLFVQANDSWEEAQPLLQ